MIQTNKELLRVALVIAILHYSFINVIPVLFWITTAAYAIIGVISSILTYGLVTKSNWMVSSEIMKKHLTVTGTAQVIVFNVVKIILTIATLVYTGNYYHLLAPLAFMCFWLSLYNYAK